MKDQLTMLKFDARAARVAWTVSALPLFLAATYLLRKTLLVFAIALMFAYLVYPLIELIERRMQWKSRTPALVLPFLLVLSLIAGSMTFIGSHVGSEAAQLSALMKSPDFPARVHGWRPMNLPAGEQIAEHYSQIPSMIPQFGHKLASASKDLVTFIIVPILAFFVLKDRRKIHECFLNFFPAHKHRMEGILRDINGLMLEYMRALLLLCLVTLICFSIGLSLLGVPYAVLLAAVSFPLEFIPLVGPLAGAIVILGVSAFSGYPHLVWVAIFLGGYRIFQDYVVSPYLMSRSVKLHPLLVIFGIFAGGELGGVAGIFLSVPVLALLRLIYHEVSHSRMGTKALAIAS